MPQMSPLQWEIMFIFSVYLVLMLMAIFFFQHIIKSSQIFKLNKTYGSLHLIWMW